jgi:hypothetical protein
MKKEIIAIIMAAASATNALACTSAIIGADKTVDGRPLLWKHRDTSATDNKVEYIAGKNGELSFVALFNASDRKCSQSWIGMNEAGFAIMNTASYNLHPLNTSKKNMDREGYVMTQALQCCRTIDDFAKLLDGLPRPMGVEANFGVIDAYGNGAYFETNNERYWRYDLADAPDHVLVRTNYSHSGRDGEGSGHVREANACVLLKPYVDSCSVSPEVLTETLSRSFYRDVQQRDYAVGDEQLIADVDFIPRYTSVASVVIEGMRPGDRSVTREDIATEYIMWTAMGYPPCAEVVPVWCSPNGVDQELRGTLPDGHSAMSDKVKKRRDDVFELPRKGHRKYVDVRKLYNAQGTGYVQVLTGQNHAVYEKFRHRGR